MYASYAAKRDSKINIRVFNVFEVCRLLTSQWIQGLLEVFTALVKDSRHAGSVYSLSEGFKACWKCLKP